MWIVIPKDSSEQSVEYPAPMLVMSLLGQMINQPLRADHQILVDAITDQMNQKMLLTASMTDITMIGFRLGYLYRLFLEKNNVALPELPAEDTGDLSQSTDRS